MFTSKLYCINSCLFPPMPFSPQRSMLWLTRMEPWRLWTTWAFPMLSCHLPPNRSPAPSTTTAARGRPRPCARETRGLFIPPPSQVQLSLRIPSRRLTSASTSTGSTPTGKRRRWQCRSDSGKFPGEGLGTVEAAERWLAQNKTAWSSTIWLSLAF